MPSRGTGHQIAHWCYEVRLPKGNIKDTLASWEPLEAEPGEKRLSEVLSEMRDEERY
jgi:hypothetical protein